MLILENKLANNVCATSLRIEIALSKVRLTYLEVLKHQKSYEKFLANSFSPSQNSDVADPCHI